MSTLSYLEDKLLWKGYVYFANLITGLIHKLLTHVDAHTHTHTVTVTGEINYRQLYYITITITLKFPNTITITITGWLSVIITITIMWLTNCNYYRLLLYITRKWLYLT